MVVYTSGGDHDYSTVAADVASDRGERVETELAAIEGDETVLYVESPTRVREHDVVTLQKLLRPDGSLGVITGRTPGEARSLYRRSDGDGDHDCLLLRGSPKDFETPDPDATVLAKDDATIANFRRLHDDGLRSLSFQVTGDNIHATFDDGYLCGFPSTPERFDFDGNQPSCAVDGTMDCPFDGTVIHADRISVPHVFLNGCPSPIDNNPENYPVNLTLGLLSNARGVLAPYRVLLVSPIQIALHHGLLRAGKTLSERMRVLNRSAEAATMEVAPYVAFGDPETSLAEPDPREYDVAIEWIDGECHATLTGVDTPIVELQFPRAKFHPDPRSGFYVRAVDGHVDDLYFSAFPEGEDVRVFVFGWGTTTAEELRLRVSSRSTLERADVASLLRRTELLDRVGQLPGEARGQAREARNNYAGTSKYAKREPYNATVHRTLTARVENVRDALAAARDTVVDDLLNTGGSPFPSKFWDRTEAEAVTLRSSYCPYCGRDAVVQTLTDALGDLRRKQGRCPNCAYLFDVPEVGGRTEFPRVPTDVVGVPDDESGRLSVEFTSPYERRLEATVAVAPSGSTFADFEEPMFRPETVEVDLTPGESLEVGFEYDTTMVDTYEQTGKFAIDAYVVPATLDVFVGERTMFVQY